MKIRLAWVSRRRSLRTLASPPWSPRVPSFLAPTAPQGELLPRSSRPPCSPPGPGWPPARPAGTLSGSLYRDPNCAVVSWVAANPSDSRTPADPRQDRQPAAARWLANFNPSTVQSEVSAYIGAANAAGPGAGAVGLRDHQPGLRRCQRRWRAGPEPVPDSGSRLSRSGTRQPLVIIILETDSIALQTCLNATDLAARNQALTTAVQTIKARQRQRQGVPRRRPLGLEQRRGPGQPAARGRHPVRRRLLHQRVELQLDRATRPTTAAHHLRAERRPASAASARSSTPAATAAPPATGAPTTTPTGASASTRR